MTPQQINEIQDAIAFAERDTFTDEEILAAFKETGLGLSAAFLSEHILPQVYGNEFDGIDFDGQNCDDCDGASGFSRRCNCGNRRVYWCGTYKSLTAD